ncbi:MAG: PAS domain S-box protein [Candidatus Lokiarchaeota archaeon]|nr:PAS domain S-box protein [Candidatus Lokiarchaeota archaeon]
MKDITEHQNSEVEFRNNMKIWQLSLDAIKEAIFLIDLNHKILQCNKATLDIFRKSNYKEVIGHYCWELMHDNSEPKELCPLKRMQQSGKKETVIEMVNGCLVEISANPVFDYKGEINGAVHVITDITSRKRIVDALRESEQQYRTILNSLNDPMHVIDKELKIIFQNPTMVKWLDKLNLKSDIIAKNIFEVFPFLDYDKIYNEYSKVFKTGEPFVTREITELFNKKVFTEIIKIPIKSEGKVDQVITIIRDITEQKEAEQKLKNSEEKYRYLIENSIEGVWVIDSGAKTILVNPSMSKILGYKVEEMIGKPLFSFMDKKEKEITKNHLEKRKKGISEERDAYFLHKKGYKVYLRIRATPIFDIEGNYEGTSAFLADITQRKLTEQALKESEEKYRLISENTDDLIVVYNENELVDYFNTETHSRILGYSTEKFKDKVFRDALVHEDDREIAETKVSEGLKKGSYYYQFRLKHKSGNYIWFEVTGKIFEDNYGNTKILCVSRNIDAKKSAEYKIKESEENFRTIAEQAFIGTLIIQDDKVEYVNSALLQIFEYSHEEINNWRKKDLVKLIYPEDLQYLREYREKLRAGESDIKRYYTYRVFTKYGKIRWIDQFSRPIIYRGKRAELVSIMDITEKKRAEQELMKLNSLKSELLRRTSHELKTPLVSIKGFSDLLLTVHKDKLDDYVLATIHEIKLGCERLENLIQDILKTSELDSKSVELKKSEENLSFLIKLCVKELQGLIRLRNHKISLEIHDKLIASFEPDQIHLVISNILNNAIKYTPPNGKIKIRSAIVDDSILILIRDNGIGITYEEKKRLFSQFGKIERYGQGLDIISEGSGLGLFITKKIVELHGGKIWVKSGGRNKGSTFYFTLPLI